MTSISMSDSTKYQFGFTTSSLRLKEMIIVAQHLVEQKEMDYVNELGNGKEKTGRSMFYELRKRIETLTNEQRELLANGNLNEQRSIAFLAVCKTYGFIRDFVVEVLRDKCSVYDFEISTGDYFTFFHRKSDQHAEMEELSEETEKKIRQVIFKILEQAEIIDSIKYKTIQTQFIEASVLAAIKVDDLDWLKIFLISDDDIADL